MRHRSIVGVCGLVFLATSCGQNLGFGGSSKCDPIQLTDSTSAHFEVDGETVRLFVDVAGQPEAAEVFGTDLDSAATLMISVGVGDDPISMDSPGVEAVVRGADSQHLSEIVTPLSVDGQASRCDTGDVQIDFIKVEARHGFSIGRQDVQVSNDAPASGIVTQIVLS